MDIAELIYPLRRWWWLIVLATVIAAGASFAVARQQPPTYQSRATLMIGRTIENPNPTSVQFSLEEQLAVSYANIANREPLRDATMEALGLDWLPEYSVTAVPNTQLIEIVVVDTDPQRAQIVASEIANQLILGSPTSTNQADVERQAFISQQLDTLQKQITDTQAELEDLSQLLGELNSAREISDTQNQISSLKNSLASLQLNYANLLSNTEKGAINTLTIIEQPHVPTSPVGSKMLVTVGLSAAVGFTLAAAAAYLLEFLDKTIKTVDEVKRLIKAPILGYIPEIPRKEDRWHFVTNHPRSPISDAFRNLRINVDLLGVETKTIMISGSAISEGKSTIALNYAQIATQANKKVVFVDGDLRKSKMKEALKLEQDTGLSTLLNSPAKLKDVVFTLDQRLTIIPSGSCPPNPTELLGSEKMDRILTHIKGMADLIVVDSPPLFVTDAAVLAKKVDGILLVVQLGKSRRDTVKEMMVQIERTGTSVLGVIINKISSGSNYYSKYYGSYYNIPDSEQNDADISETEIENNPQEPGVETDATSEPPKDEMKPDPEIILNEQNREISSHSEDVPQGRNPKLRGLLTFG
ncbi:MAG TPA: hypothetical protein DEH25_09280 [Chloroflexi bacterium]|nr:hypothetical protein [Chloroflexota bacterium]HBY09201.1 hypothetical protein [Chloroflexota bacterium]